MEKRDWIIELTQELKNEAEVSRDEPERWKKRAIYKVPVHAANLNKDAYNPWVAAIGPYHHNDGHLKRMEEHKKRALRHFLCRSEKPLESYVDALSEVVHDLMDAYAHLDITWQRDAKRFLQLMIVDGCFILEMMRADGRAINDYSSNDLIFSHHGQHNIIPCIKRDMLLVENQVPLLVLEKLLAVESGNIEQSEQVIELILKFYGRPEIVSARQIGQCQHILDIFRRSMILEVSKNKPASPSKGHIDEETVHSATEMREAGINFQKGDRETLKDISFTGGTLRLPAISLDDTSESTFLNMVAFERLHVGAGNEISSYIFFMNRLISDVRDVRLLKSCGIISNVMGSDEDVAKLFCTLSKEILVDSSLSSTWLNKVYMDINNKLGSHFKKTFYKWRYHLIHTYFRSPWAVVSVIAAAFSLGLSIAQVIYAVLSFIHRKQ